MAMLNVRYIGTAFFPESYEDATLLWYQFDADAGLTAISPGRAANGRQPFLGIHVTYFMKILFNDLLFVLQLCIVFQVLETTAATNTEG